MSSSQYPRGFQPLPRDLALLPFAHPVGVTTNLTIDDLSLPDSKLIQEAKSFLSGELGELIWNHSHRAFLFAKAIVLIQLGKTVDFDAESFYLACLFHDIGVVDKHMHSTKMSFEYHGGILARDWLLKHGASNDLADAVAEAIFRHTDFCKGRISVNGALIQIGTLYDNIFLHGHLLPENLVGHITEAFPRENWGMCFKTTMEKEIQLKPWSHASELAESESEAWDKILNNKLEELARIF